MLIYLCIFPPFYTPVVLYRGWRFVPANPRYKRGSLYLMVLVWIESMNSRILELLSTISSFINHIENTISSALRILGFIIRNSRDFQNLETLRLLYFSLVRLKLEYASFVWCPTYKIHSANLERVQRRFLKYMVFRQDGIYPAVGYPHQDLLNRFYFILFYLF